MRPDAVTGYTVTMDDDMDKDKGELAPVYRETYNPSWTARVGRRSYKVSMDRDKPVEEIWDDRRITRIIKERQRIGLLPRVVREYHRNDDNVLRGALVLPHRLGDWQSVLSGVMSVVRSIGGMVKNIFFADPKTGRIRVGTDPTQAEYFPNSFQGGVYVPSEDGLTYKRAKKNEMLDTVSTWADYLKYMDSVIVDNSGPSVDRCNVATPNQFNFLGTVSRAKLPAAATKKTSYNIRYDSGEEVIDYLPIIPHNMGDKMCACQQL